MQKAKSIREATKQPSAEKLKFRDLDGLPNDFVMPCHRQNGRNASTLLIQHPQKAYQTQEVNSHAD